MTLEENENEIEIKDEEISAVENQNKNINLDKEKQYKYNMTSEKIHSKEGGLMLVLSISFCLFMSLFFTFMGGL